MSAEIQQSNQVLEAVRYVYRNHATKILGYIQIIAGAVAVADPSLVGPDTIRWAIFVTGVLTALRGHTNRVPPVK